MADLLVYLLPSVLDWVSMETLDLMESALIIAAILMMVLHGIAQRSKMTPEQSAAEDEGWK